MQVWIDISICNCVLIDNFGLFVSVAANSVVLMQGQCNVEHLAEFNCCKNGTLQWERWSKTISLLKQKHRHAVATE